MSWLGIAVRDLHMRPKDFWSLPLFVWIKLMSQDSDEPQSITRKELLAEERKFYKMMEGLPYADPTREISS